jgi:hypothetical protein
MITFGNLHPDGTLSDVRILSHAAIGHCPHLIMVPEHYRDDDTCRCDDADHTEMAEWGYLWNGELWIGDEDDG